MLARLKPGVTIEQAQAELDAIAVRAPAIAWLGFTVHGDEASGAEASLALLYQLAAGTDADTRRVEPPGASVVSCWKERCVGSDSN